MVGVVAATGIRPVRSHSHVPQSPSSSPPASTSATSRSRPGTFGSVPGLALCVRPEAAAAVVGRVAGHRACSSALGVWAATAAERHFGQIDPGPVVHRRGRRHADHRGRPATRMDGLLIAFVVFRVCDVIKPFPAAQMRASPGRAGCDGRRRDGGGVGASDRCACWCGRCRRGCCDVRRAPADGAGAAVCPGRDHRGGQRAAHAAAARHQLAHHHRRAERPRHPRAWRRPSSAIAWTTWPSSLRRALGARRSRRPHRRARPDRRRRDARRGRAGARAHDGRAPADRRAAAGAVRESRA